jgi:hypothetical protein
MRKHLIAPALSAGTAPALGPGAAASPRCPGVWPPLMMPVKIIARA